MDHIKTLKNLHSFMKLQEGRPLQSQFISKSLALAIEALETCSIRKCEHCGRDFPSKSKGTRFCSQKCNVSFNNKNKK